MVERPSDHCPSGSSALPSPPIVWSARSHMRSLSLPHQASVTDREHLGTKRIQRAYHSWVWFLYPPGKMIGQAMMSVC